MRFDQFKINLLEAILDEAPMTPKAFQEFLGSELVTGMKMGFELESIIHNVRDYNDESEADYSYDERVGDIDDIVDFFSGGDGLNGERELSALRNNLYDDFMAWQDAEFDDYLRSDEAQTDLKEYTREYLEDKDYNDRQMKLAFDSDADKDEKLENDFEEGRMQALEKMRDEWQDEGSADWKKYCDVMDMNYMSDVQNKYEHYLYWPHETYNDEEYLNVDWVADELESDTGIKAQGFTDYHGGSRSRAQEKGEWIIEPDSSIDTNDSDEGGLEFVSPALDINTAIEQMQKVLQFIREHGYTNDSTGLHINISVPDYNTDKLDYVKLAIFLGDKHILEQFDRLSNHYCDGAYKKIGGKISSMKPAEISAVMNKMKEGLTLAASKIIHTGYTSKYTSINTKEGYIEFRSPGGDYLNKEPNELINTALRMALALRISTDENMYKQEYQKRLYKLLTDAGEKDDLIKFKDYIAQYQSADPQRRKYIVQTIQMEREARAEKKKPKTPGESMPYWMVKRRDGTGGGMAVHAATAIDAVKEVARSFEKDPVDLFAIPMAEEEVEQRGSNIFVMKDDAGREYRQRANISREARNLVAARYGIRADSLTVVATENPPSEGQTGKEYIIDYNGQEYRQRANSKDEARALLSARTGIERNLLWDIKEAPPEQQGMATGGTTVDGNRGTGAGSHNWRIYRIADPDFFSVVAADTRTDAVNRWNILHPDAADEMVDAVPDEGAMKYEFTIAQHGLNPLRGQEGQEQFINPQELYTQRTGRTEMPVRRIWATNKEQALSKVRTYFPRDFFDVPEDHLKINVVGV